jgi:hypothetical protein
MTLVSPTSQIQTKKEEVNPRSEIVHSLVSPPLGRYLAIAVINIAGLRLCRVINL